MSELSNKPTQLPAADATVDVAPGGLAHAGMTDSSSAEMHACRVAFCEGTASELGRETQGLLRRRLRMAALVLFAGLAAFLVKHAIEADFAAPADIFLFSFHALTTAVLGAIGLGLCHRHSYTLGMLRLAELLTFGLPATFFAVICYVAARYYSVTGRFDFPEGAWLLLIFTYALFIPNTLRRAALVIGLLAAVPIVLLGLMVFTCPLVATAVGADQLVNIVLMIGLAAAGSIFGVDTIGTLRREAFEARQLGQYRLTRRIGAGGMGEVYLAEHRLLKRPCVVKLIRADKAGNPNVLARFQREVRATAKLTHWNTVEIYDYGVTEDGTFYYAMEYLPGLSLGELVERYGPLPAERVIYLLRQVCDALQEAHAMGLIHRDIKPGNIFAAQRGGFYDVAKLLDFGLVRPIVEQEHGELTAEGSITGSPLFMSPEQSVGETHLDARSDVYSLGGVAYYLLTGRPMFTSDKPLKVLFAHVHEPVVPPSQLRPDVPADLEQVVLRCLSKAPEDRYPDAASLEQALAQCAAGDAWTRDDAARWWSEHEEDVRVPSEAPAVMMH